MGDRKKALKELAAQLRPVPVGGIHKTLVMITPKSVHRLKLGSDFGGGGRISLPRPRLLEPRSEITFDIYPKRDGVKSLKQGTRLYDAGLIFPDSGTPSDHVEIVEIDFGGHFNRTRLEQREGESFEESMKKNDLILTALVRDRYWLAIPSNVYPEVSFSKTDLINPQHGQ